MDRMLTRLDTSCDALSLCSLSGDECFRAVCVCVCTRAYIVCVHACMHTCVCVCMCGKTHGYGIN